MLVASQDFIKAMTGSIVEIWVKFEMLDKNDKVIGEYTRHISSNDAGDISIDYNRDIRRMFTITFDNSDGQFTWGVGNLIWLDNKRIKLYIGLKLPDGNVEYVPQGVFVITEPENTSKKDGAKVTINGQDKVYLLNSNMGKFQGKVTFAKGMTIRTAIKTIALNGGIPESMMMLDDCTITIPYDATFDEGETRWSAIQTLTKLAIYDTYFDVNGMLRFEPKKQPELEAPCWTYDKTTPNTLYNGSARKLNDQELFNHITVLGGSSQTAVARADLVIDLDNPEINFSSLSDYSIQNIGRRIYYWNNGSLDSMIDHNVQAMYRAKYEAKRNIALHEAVTFEIAPNYLHEAGDVISIVDEVNGCTGNYVLETFSIPIKPKLVSCQASKVVEFNLPQVYTNNVTQKLTGTGSQTAFTLDYAPELALYRTFDSNGVETSRTTKYEIRVDGAVQSSGWTVNKITKTLTFTVAPSNGAKIEIDYRVLV